MSLFFSRSLRGGGGGGGGGKGRREGCGEVVTLGFETNG